MKTLLIIGHTFPEPTTTAAGNRMMQLISLFSEENYQITFASSAITSEKTANLTELGVIKQSIELNSSSFDLFISQLKPDIVLFDRFITEEQFGWRVAENCPSSLRILDTEDLHFLRKAREEAVKRGGKVEEADLYSDTAKRELASIFRCDLSLLISEVEINLLKTTFGVSSKILQYVPFLVKNESESVKNDQLFDKRVDFVTIGNFLHSPNLDSVLYLKNEIWPGIRKRLPAVNLHVYGAYVPQQINELHTPRDGFLIEGWTEDALNVLRKSRVCLAPLRYGAGLKGKILDAMLAGTPVVTTAIGAEGINGEFAFPGIVTDDVRGFVDASVELYTKEDSWQVAHQNAFPILERRFKYELFSEVIKQRILKVQENLQEHRNRNFTGQILQQQQLKATKYMSLWIEEKNKR